MPGEWRAVADWLVESLFSSLAVVFTEEWVAPLIILPAMLLLATALFFRGWGLTAPFLRACTARIATLDRALGTDRDPVAERQAFAQNFVAVKTALESRRLGSEPLVRAWHEFHESIVDETESPIRNTIRPSVFFGRAVPSLHFLVFWSNVFVGLGLLFTFLGIVVALNAAGHGMNGNTAATQSALQELLKVAGAKFFASIGGLSASLALRFADAALQKRIRRKVDKICSLLERGLLYVPPQLLAAQQLEELKRVSAQLERFNTDLAMTIGEQVAVRFQTAVEPIAESLGVLNDNMASLGRGMRDTLGQGAADAVNAAANGELRALGRTLEALRGQLERMTLQVGGSGEEAARQIRAAGSDFSEAAREIRLAFEHLTSQVDGIGTSLTAESEAVSKRNSEAIQQTLLEFQAAQADAARALSATVQQLGEAGRNTANTLQASVGEALREATAESQNLLRAAVSESGARFAEAAGQLTEAVRSSARSIAELSEAILKTERGVSGVAEAFTLTAEGARSVASVMVGAADGFATAASPVAQAARAIESAVDKVSRSAADLTGASSAALAGLNSLATEIGETSSAAAEAWHDYRARFENVDASLQKTLEDMSGALGDSIQRFKDFAQQFDLEMSNAVSRLSTILDPIQENTEAIADLAHAMQKPPLAAE